MTKGQTPEKEARLKHVFVLVLALTAACHTSRAYKGRALRPDEVATIRIRPPVDAFDMTLRPPKMRIARVDDRTFDHRRVTMLPGKHQVVITSKTRSRLDKEKVIEDQFVVDVDVLAGKTYLVTGRQIVDKPLQLWILDRDDGRILAQTKEE